MRQLQLLASDLGSYAALLAIFLAYVCYRANPLRSFNRYFAAYTALIAPWQLVVALARTTKHYEFWGPIASPFGAFLAYALFLTHDAALVPHDTLRGRFNRSSTALLTAIVFCIGVVLASTYNTAPLVFPLSYRAVCTITIIISLAAGIRRRSRTSYINPYERTLVNITTFSYIILITVYLLVRIPIGSRIISASMIFFELYTVYLLLSERVLDVQGTAKIALGNILLFLTQASCATIALVFLAYFNENSLNGVPLLLIAGVTLAIASIFQFFVFPLTRNFLIPLSAKTAEDLRYEAVRIAAAAESEHALIEQLQTAAKRFLGGLDVRIASYPRNPQPGDNFPDARAQLAAHTPPEGLTPASATHQIKSPLLDSLLDCFTSEQLGAVVKYASQRITAVCFVNQRSGGQKPITVEELSCLRELTIVAASGLDRIRATNENFRARVLAMIGQTQAFRSHQARNQLEPIRGLLEALAEGRYNIIPPHHITAVYDQCLDLITDLDFSLDLTRIQPAHTNPVPVDLGELLAGTTTAAQRLTRNSQTTVSACCESGLWITTDARIVRQILLNLIKNSVEATTEGAPTITLGAERAGEVVHIDVVDNGPGISPSIHEQLFTPWVTTKVTGTGLGLTFCQACANTLNGRLQYLTPVGKPNAHFRLTLPVQFKTSGSEAPQTANSLENPGPPASAS